jgi:tetratricopeptide (TPR) repeat protein
MSLKDGERLLRENAKDNYAKILRVFNYGDENIAKQLYPQMDRVIEKASIAIQKHSMVFSNKEYVRWVKKSYLIMGIANFYKHDYIKARRIFDYVYKQYQDDPIRYEALLWLVKTYIAVERYEKADAALNLLMTKYDDDNFPEKVRRELPYVQSDFYLVQEKYSDAYPYLERAVEINYKRYLVTRVLFILGQINQKDGDFERAASYYQKVIKRNPPFEMAFNARLNIAKCFDSNTGNKKAIIKLLTRMAKEAKNKDYLDQIYYALAEVEIKEGNDSLAIDYLRKSVAASIGNDMQRAQSALKVADMLFKDKEYELSEKYFDSAVSVLPQDYPNYEFIKSKSLVLTQLVREHIVIKTQDSLQYLASLSEDELNALITQKIDEYKKAEEERLKKEAEEAQAMTYGIESQTSTFGGAGMPGMGGGAIGRPGGGLTSMGGRGNGKWYFYNPQIRERGYGQFVGRWGKRKLEDNWFLKDKRQVMSSGFDQAGDAGGEGGFGENTSEATNDSLAVNTGDLTPGDPAYYTKDIPKTEEDFKISDSLIVEAYNKLGFLYREELNDTLTAIRVYEEFLDRFPGNKYELESWFALYQLYSGSHNSLDAEKYKSLILLNYPDSDYAKIIVDPDYFIKLAQKKGQVFKLYERTYKAFEREQYFRVLAYANKAIEEYADDTSSVIPKILYVRAIALGKITTADSMYSALKDLVQRYPQSNLVPMADDIMRFLRKDYGLDGGEPEEQNPEEQKKEYNFVVDDNVTWFVIIVVNSKKVDVNPLKVRLSDFNKKYFKLTPLKVKSLLLDDNNTFITIGNFENKKVADRYFYFLNSNTYVFSGIEKENYKIFPISTKNYPILYRDKNVDEYIDFLKDVYGYSFD